MYRAPRAAFWTWVTVLQFCLHNQRLGESIKEDRLNKPWRPLPAGRLAESKVKYVMIATYTATFLSSLYFGGFKQSAMLTILDIWYNDLGASENVILRNTMNASGYLCFLSGALEVAVGSSDLFQWTTAMKWLVLIGAVIFSTIHIQDFRDVPGDLLRRRRTMPIILGDGLSRWTVVVGIFFWSWVCPSFWQVGLGGFVLPVIIGGVIVFRILAQRTIKHDRLTYKIWCFWFMSFFLLPLVKTYSGT